jgi:hypothetical protein
MTVTVTFTVQKTFNANDDAEFQQKLDTFVSRLEGMNCTVDVDEEEMETEEDADDEL